MPCSRPALIVLALTSACSPDEWPALTSPTPSLESVATTTVRLVNLTSRQATMTVSGGGLAALKTVDSTLYVAPGDVRAGGEIRVPTGVSFPLRVEGRAEGHWPVRAEELVAAASTSSCVATLNEDVSEGLVSLHLACGPD